jgi:hypothetical protein
MMKIAVFANTPAQVHFYNRIMEKLKEHGHEVRLLLRDYGETVDLADELHLEYFVYSKTFASKMSKITLLPRDVLVAYKHLRKFRPDVVTGFGVYDALTAALLNAHCVEFEDSEPRVNSLYSIQFKACMPFVDAFVTPSSFMDDLGEKQIRIASFKELAYLHPNYYVPNDDVFDVLGIRRNDDYVLLRFNAFDAVHDLGVNGFPLEAKRELVRQLAQFARIVISCETPLPADLEILRLDFPKSRIHDLICQARLVVADTGTIITEAACLGTPAVMLHSNARNYGNFVELEDRYGLIRTFCSDWRKAIDAAVSLIRNPQTKAEWADKRQVLLRDKVDMTEFMVGLIEHFVWQRYDRVIRSKRGGQPML